MTSQGSSKTDFVSKTYCVFGSENLIGSSLRKVPHLPCVVTLSYFEVSRFSLFVWLVLVVILPTKLVSPHSEFICKSYGGFSSDFRFCVLSDLVRPQAVLSGPNPEVGRNPATYSSFRMPSGMTVKTFGSLSDVIRPFPDVFRDDRENSRFAVGLLQTQSGGRIWSGISGPGPT